MFEQQSDIDAGAEALFASSGENDCAQLAVLKSVLQRPLEQLE